MSLDSVFDYIRHELPTLGYDVTWGGSVAGAKGRLGQAVEERTTQGTRDKLLRAAVLTVRAILELEKIGAVVGD